MSFPPVPSTEITKDGRNLSPAWIAFFSQVFNNSGSNYSAVNSGSPVLSGNVTLANLTVTGTASVAGAAGFSSAVGFSGDATFSAGATFAGTLQASGTSSFNSTTNFNSAAQFNGTTTFSAASSVSFLHGFSSTTGTFTSSITGTTLTLSGLATFNAGATGTNASFSTGALGNYSWSGNDMTSSDQMNFYTLNADIPASVLAMNIDNQQRLNFPSVSLIGGPPGKLNPINFFQQNRSFEDNLSPPSTSNTDAVSNYFANNTLSASNTGVTYTYGTTMYIAGAIDAGTNVTISEQMALWVNSGNSFFANTFYVGTGAGSVATSNATGAFVSQGVLGYGKDAAGNSSGGAVTQGTSKSQGVTLNKGCGVITMNAAALAAGASVEFVLTNSFIAATDTVICNMGPGGTASTYLVQCQAVAAGSCRFRVTNYSGTSRSEACVVNFSIIKTVNA